MSVNKITPSRLGNGTTTKLMVPSVNNLAFSFFVFTSTVIFIFLFLASFPIWSVKLNKSLLGKFKRPLPTNPELYYDINCIDTMKAEDFAEENQVQRCRQLRPIDRPGPPRGR